MSVSIPSPLIFGIPDSGLPLLPAGWSYRFQSDDFASLIGPDGKEYYLEVTARTATGKRKLRANLWDFVRTFGKLKWGEHFMNERETVNPLLDELGKAAEHFARKDLSNQLSLFK